MLGLSQPQIRAYAERGFLDPERGARGELRFGFQDLIVLRTAAELTAARIPQRKIQRVLELLRAQLPEGRSLTGVRIAADGERIVVRDEGTLWNPESGQALFDFSVSELAEKSAPFTLRAIDDARRRAEELSAAEWYALACDLEVTSPGEAKEAYARTLALDPRHADAHVNLGRILHEERAMASAEEHYRAALEADRNHETAAFNLAVALEDLGRFDEALATYRRALDIDPTNADAHYNLAGLYERQGEKQAALRHLKAYRTLRS